jgi:hypothetical protein
LDKKSGWFTAERSGSVSFAVEESLGAAFLCSDEPTEIKEGGNEKDDKPNESDLTNASGWEEVGNVPGYCCTGEGWCDGEALVGGGHDEGDENNGCGFLKRGDREARGNWVDDVNKELLD